MSQSPRVKRKRDISRRERLRSERYAPVPVSRKKNWGAKVSDPASEEQGDRGSGGIGGIKAGLAEVIAGVIESHQNHDDAAKNIN